MNMRIRLAGGDVPDEEFGQVVRAAGGRVPEVISSGSEAWQRALEKNAKRRSN